MQNKFKGHLMQLDNSSAIQCVKLVLRPIDTHLLPTSIRNRNWNCSFYITAETKLLHLRSELYGVGLQSELNVKSNLC